MKKLIIAEKPSLAKNIANALGVRERKNGYIEGEHYILTWVFGHLFGLKNIEDYLGEKKAWKDLDLPFFPSKFEFKLKEDDGINKQFKIIKELSARDDVSELVNSGDADREGQVIVDIVIEKTGSTKSVKRLWLPEQTEETIKNEIQNLKSNDDYKNLLNEGLTRTYMDWLFGINLTTSLTVKSGGLLPVGRVLLPVVKYIYDRDKEIAEFKKSKFFNLESITNFKDENIKLSLNKKYLNKEEANLEALNLNKNKAKVIEIVEKDIVKQPGKLFSLSKLQSKISKDLKINFETSLKLIQSLYEQGYITYPRTNTEYLATNEKDKVTKIIEKINGNENIKHKLIFKDKKTIFDDSKIESHSALTPTTKIPVNLTGNELAIYEIVLNRFIAVFYETDSIISQRIIKVSVGDEIIALKGNTVKEKGFLAVEPQKTEDNLPNLSENDEFDINFKAIEKETTPPAKINESSLSNYLKNPFKKESNEDEDENINDDDEYKQIMKGIEIGTEATRTGIIANAIKYKYITLTKDKFNISEKGKILIELLEKLQIDMSTEKTVEFSVIQKEVFNGEKNIDDVIAIVQKNITESIDKIKNTELEEKFNVGNIENQKEEIGNCPVCEKPIYENQKSFYCSNYKECSFKGLWKEDKFFNTFGKKITKSTAKKLLKDNKIKLSKLKSKKTGKEFEATIVVKSWTPYISWELDFSKK